MSKNRIIIILGVLVALMPIFGFPRPWESFFQVLLGLSIVVLSVWSSVDRYLTLKAKAQKRQLYKQREADMAGQGEGSRSFGQEFPGPGEAQPFQKNNL